MRNKQTLRLEQVRLELGSLLGNVRAGGLGLGVASTTSSVLGTTLVLGTTNNALLSSSTSGRALGWVLGSLGSHGVDNVVGHSLVSSCGRLGSPVSSGDHLLGVSDEATWLGDASWLGVEDRGSRGVHGSHGGGVLPHLGTLGMLCLELGLTHIASLSQSHVKGLASEDSSVHLSDGSCGFLRSAVADKSESLAVDLVISHDLAGGDGSIGSKLSAEFVIIDSILQVLDVEVNSLVLVESLELQLLSMLIQGTNRKKRQEEKEN